MRDINSTPATLESIPGDCNWELDIDRKWSIQNWTYTRSVAPYITKFKLHIKM